MRLSDIISMAGFYLRLGGVLVLGATALFCTGYFFVYKRLMGGKRRLKGTAVLWAAVFGCYLFVILSATLLDRSGYMGGGKVIPLFYSYREAWHSFSAVLWRNLALNILMFVPFGFLLPLGVRKLEAFWKTYLAGLIFTVLIELAQLVLGRGVVEMDDIFNNLLGTMIGYGLYAVVRGAFRRRGPAGRSGSERVGKARTKKGRTGHILLLQLPLAGTLLAFGILFFMYGVQDLGNLHEDYIFRYDRKLLKFSSDEVYSQGTQSLPVYQVGRKTKEEAEEQAESFLAGIGAELDKSQTDAYENTLFCYSPGRSYHIQVRYAGGIYSFMDWSSPREEGAAEAVREADATEPQVRAALKEYGVSLPEESAFENKGDGVYFFSVEQYAEDGVIYDGTLSCTYCGNGRMEKIDNRILTGTPYKYFEVISEKEAYDRLCAGEFAYSIYLSGAVLEGTIGEARLVYRMDTKGFYQPVYEFEAVINGNEDKILIPAVRDKNGGSLKESDNVGVGTASLGI